jgi:hypothetical protein
MRMRRSWILALGLGASSLAASPEALTETFATENGLLKLHYPADFAAKSVTKGVVVVSRNLGNGWDEAATFAAIEKPISDDAREFARVFDKASLAKRTNFVEQKRTETDYREGRGVETVGTWGKPGKVFRLHQWTFVRHGHGYHFEYSVPDAQAAKEEPVVQSILAAVEFSP